MKRLKIKYKSEEIIIVPVHRNSVDVAFLPDYEPDLQTQTEKYRVILMENGNPKNLAYYHGKDSAMEGFIVDFFTRNNGKIEWQNQ